MTSSKLTELKGVTFEEAVKMCVENKEFIVEYKRLTGARLGSGTPWEKLIDQATKYQDKEWFDLFNFIRDYIWMPVVLDNLLVKK